MENERAVERARSNIETNTKFEEVQLDLLTSNYTRLYREKEFKYNAPHRFRVLHSHYPFNGDDFEPLIAEVHFQEGPIKECGVNGVNNEDLICMVLDRLQHFQKSEYSCRENACAITKLEEALMWLRKRTNARAKRGVEGTSAV